jgi:site-specific recombinase XerD
MLEQYFVRPETIDRIRASWIAEPIERYVVWMHERGYAATCVQSRVPVLVKFGEFAAQRGVRTWEELPQHVVPFVRSWERSRRSCLRPRSSSARGGGYRWEIQHPVEQMLQRVLPGFEGSFPHRRLPVPFVDQVPEFVPYLRSERGLREATIDHHVHYVRHLEHYLRATGRVDVRRLTPSLLREFIEEASRRLSTASIAGICDSVRTFLRYLHREQILARDLSRAIERPRIYHAAQVPRSIPWEQTERLLRQIDRRGGVGRRDFAIVLLLVTYGLRAREIAALRLDDIDWRSGILRIPERKGGHSTHYRLTPAVGDALADYIEHVRPRTQARQVFFGVFAPYRPLRHYSVSQRTSYWLKRAGIAVPRAGSHTLRHTVVQRLLDQGFSLKQIGDYVGHRSPDSTQTYAKIDLGHLREIATGYGEEAL